RGAQQRLLDRVCRPAVPGSYARRPHRLSRRRPDPAGRSRDRRFSGVVRQAWPAADGRAADRVDRDLLPALRRLRRRAARLVLWAAGLRRGQQRTGGALFGRARRTGQSGTVCRFELDIITAVLLGGVSIFGGNGNLAGVGIAILVILNLRNGMGLADITGNTQNYVIGGLLILSVLAPNVWHGIRHKWKGRGT